MTIEEFSSALAPFGSALIFCHSRPDGDTLGCASALKAALVSLGKTADIVCDSFVPAKFGFLGFSGEVLRPGDVTRSYEAHVAVDCSVESMLGESYAVFRSCRNTFNIDHHVSNSRYAKYNYVAETAACCESVYRLILGFGVRIDEVIANRLLLGISTDTGHFSHNNVTADTMRIASELVASGADIHEISFRMYKNQPVERARLYAKVISGMRLYLEGKVAVISIFMRDLREFGATKDMTEGFIDFPLSVEGVEVAVSILESKENTYKISYRSKGRVDVNAVAAAFGGGGHKMASGSMLSGFYEDVKDRILREISFALPDQV